MLLSSMERYKISIFSIFASKFKILMPSHVGSFRLASRTKEQLSVDISEPLYIDANEVDIRDDW